MGVTTVSPILTIDIALPLQALQLVDHSRSLSRLFTITTKTDGLLQERLSGAV